MSVDGPYTSVKMPDDTDGRCSTILWRTGALGEWQTPGLPGDAGNTMLAFWMLAGMLLGFVAMVWLGSILGWLVMFPVMAPAAFVAAAIHDEAWLRNAIACSALPERPVQFGWWKRHHPFVSRSGRAVVGELGPQSARYCVHYLQRIALFGRSRARLRLDVLAPTQGAIAIVTTEAVELIPPAVDAKERGLLAAACELVRGRPGALVVVLPDRVHVDIPVRADSDVAAAFTLALALPAALDSFMDAHRSGGFRDAPQPASSDDVARARALVGPAVSLPPPPPLPPAVAHPTSKPTSEPGPEAMLWPPREPRGSE